MSETPSPNDPDGTEHAAENAATGPRKRGRARRIALISVVSVLLVFGAAIAGTYAAVDHPTGNSRRIPQVFTGLDQAARPVMPAATRGGRTVLLTGRSLSRSSAREPSSGLIMLLRLDAQHDTGGVVSIPGNTIVRVPGHPSMQLQNTARVGGPALLIRTVEHLTNVRIDHYTVIDYPHEYDLVNALGGIQVNLPGPTSSEGSGSIPGSTTWTVGQHWRICGSPSFLAQKGACCASRWCCAPNSTRFPARICSPTR